MLRKKLASRKSNGKRCAIILYYIINTMLIIASQQLLPDLGDKGIFLMLGLSFVAVSVHEAGHAIIAAKLGAQIQVIAVWGLGYDFTARKLGRQIFNGDHEVAGYVRYVLIRAASSKRKHGWIAAAGPATNFIVALIATAFGSIQANVTVYGSLTIFAIMSVGIGVVNLVPFPGSDGLKIWKSISKGPNLANGGK